MSEEFQNALSEFRANRREDAFRRALLAFGAVVAAGRLRHAAAMAAMLTAAATAMPIVDRGPTVH